MNFELLYETLLKRINKTQVSLEYQDSVLQEK